ncbi:hypothetical protein BJ741DRAFT_665203 [Chytriomyces cf. hyalinus JEL632]|nr:hypothetical protein BJ741DRAFT_665203 [Chytriomyces cf. hyalinus JEL632]
MSALAWDQYVPEVSALAVDTIEVNPDTAALLKARNFENLPGVQVVNPQLSVCKDSTVALAQCTSRSKRASSRLPLEGRAITVALG